MWNGERTIEKEQSPMYYLGLYAVSRVWSVKKFPISDDFCRLLMTFANSLDPDQAQHYVGPDLDPNCLTL